VYSATTAISFCYRSSHIPRVFWLWRHGHGCHAHWRCPKQVYCLSSCMYVCMTGFCLMERKKKNHVLVSCSKATFYWKNGNQCACQPVSVANNSTVCSNLFKTFMSPSRTHTFVRIRLYAYVCTHTFVRIRLYAWRFFRDFAATFQLYLNIVFVNFCCYVTKRSDHATTLVGLLSICRLIQ
jgi:hypothetical protein